MNSHVCTEGKIWDLHIHSCQCFSAESTIKNLTVYEYVTQLLSLLSNYADLEMISFTDHNRINEDVYREFDSRGSGIVLLPGIEVDVALEQGGVSKHLVVYFDAIDNVDLLSRLASEINAFMSENHVGNGKGESPVDIHKVLDKFISLQVPFVLSPHAMKQGKRSIDYDWHSMPDEKRATEMKKYLDQFFCFWESSGHSEIAHAVDFLKQMDCDEKISIVSFSDSKDFGKLKEYLDKPNQYFNALPNYNGLKMAGSEITRITRTQDRTPENELGSYIGQVDFDGQTMRFTPRLNAIIGGRGSGKSVLLDAIASHMNRQSGELKDNRLSFVEHYPISVSTMSGCAIEQGQFHFDYYNQSYIASLFDKTGDDFNYAIERYFASGFMNVRSINRDDIRRANEESFARLLVDFDEQTPENITGFVAKLIVDTKDSLSLDIGARKSKAFIEDRKIVEFDYSKTVSDVDAAVMGKLPSSLANNKNILDAVKQLDAVICDEAYASRLAYLSGPFFQNSFVDTFLTKKSGISEAQKVRSGTIKLIEDTFNQKSLNIRKRVALIRALITVCDGFRTYYEEHDFADGEFTQAFRFMRDLRVEHPLDFMVRKINECLKAINGVGTCTRENLWDFIVAFCFDEEGYKKGSDWKALYELLKEFDLEYDQTSSISFLTEGGNYQDIRTLSPGTQTNILIEYIVHKKTDLPLLIDQPEDNVDNQTIYCKIRSWFMELKTMRQVIVVTHDANIVINADAENIIIAEQNSPGKFTYSYGALEYGNIIDRASLILDGGKDAVKRRLIKYGE